ncbi:hypothetical protein P872_16025 [Rhodonellum psychrophilum GCM71 = DSM 17998]|uniref:Lipoprotein n=2 Tax=Rhodonellum TaxID=336827 RepID=U5BS06_9BACT|nr:MULTISPECIES: hypothetical protein [Rhodonellum]ERM83350.1 hypothetical protein P872_16025 [Rhodonellum psychrophilum GCM71 = DSM 17998]MDO9551155.1 hypothetical protein [Rhodonellum sp.]SDZ38477.1 hypothetical protein SAMN05444412_11247 [Rhodonellum ikkaensis]
MKKTIIAIASIGILASCTNEKSIEERYLYEGDKIVDIETGDEYFMEDSLGFTLIHKDGSKEQVAFDDTPFFETNLSDEYVKTWKENIAEREEKLLLEKKEKFQAARKARYSDLDNEALMAKFQKAHQEKVEITLQMDMIAELIDREVIATEDAPGLLEIDIEFIDLDFNIEEADEN